MLIQDGYLLEGTLCKRTLGASGGSLIHVIFMEAGPEAARAFLSQCQCAPRPAANPPLLAIQPTVRWVNLYLLFRMHSSFLSHIRCDAIGPICTLW